MSSERVQAQNWFDNNKLTINVDKSCTVNFGSGNRFSAVFDGKPTKVMDSYKYLCVFIDKKLSFIQPFEHDCKSLGRKNGIFFKIGNFLTKFQLITFYNSCVQSIEYGLLIYGSAFKTDLNKTLRCQKPICRIIFQKTDDHITTFMHINSILLVFELYLSAAFLEMFQELHEVTSLGIMAWHEKQNKQNTHKQNGNVTSGEESQQYW